MFSLFLYVSFSEIINRSLFDSDRERENTKYMSICFFFRSGCNAMEGFNLVSYELIYEQTFCISTDFTVSSNLEWSKKK